MIATQTAPSATEALQEQPVDETTLKDALLPYVPTFEQRLLILGLLLITITALNIWAFLKQQRQHIKPAYRYTGPLPQSVGLDVRYRDPETRQSPQEEISKPRFKIRKLHVANAIFGIMIGTVIALTFFSRPYVIKTTPEMNDYLNEADGAISFEFDLPIKQEDLTMHISPEIPGEWEFEQPDTVIPVTRKVTFHPKESYYPDSEIVVYAVGIESFTGFGGTHEHSLEVKAPKIPDLASITPETGSTNVPTDGKIELTYDAPIGDFVDMSFEIEPHVAFALTTSDRIQTISFEEELEQDTEYTINVRRTPRSYDTETGEDIVVGETEIIATTTFTTVTTPYVKSWKPKGTNVSPDSSITITFDQDMLQKSVEDKFTLSPLTEGTFSWDSDKRVTYTPSKNLDKATKYTIRFEEGLLSTYEGRIPDPIELSFETIGYVKVTDTSPAGNSYGIDPNGTNIKVTFDQAVDHASAQSHFSVTPSVSGAFSWDGNTMTYSTAGNLGYSTRYTVAVSSGVKSISGLDSKDIYSFSFTTRDNVFSLSIPWYKQQEGFTCNIAAMRMVLAYRGVYLSESQIKSQLGIGDNPNQNWVPGYGVHWGPGSSLLGSYRSVEVKQGWTLTEILNEVQAGNPVVLWWYNRYSQPPGSFTLDSGVTGYMGMHSEVVRGFVGTPTNPTSILTNDPWRGQLSYSKSLFMSTWAYIGYTAVVVK